MRVIALALTALVAALHVGFMILEMFYWTEPFGLKTFNQTLEAAKQSAVLAANQGLYNGFLAAGLVYALALGLAALGVPAALVLASRRTGARVVEASAATRIASDIAVEFPKFAADPRGTFEKGRYPEDLVQRLVSALRVAGLGGAG